MRLSRGISLPELLVVLGLLTIIAAVSMPYLLGAIQNSDFNSAVRQVASDARLARSLAVSRGGYYRLHAFDKDASAYKNSYRVEHCNPCTNPPGVAWPANDAQMGSNSDVISNWQDLFTLNKGVTIVSVVDGSSTAIDGAIFNSTGASIGSSNNLRAVSVTLQKPDGTTKVIQADPAGNVKMP
jgi:Tfp pilus assembly protein FimT